MSDFPTPSTSTVLGRQLRDDALQLGPPKKVLVVTLFILFYYLFALQSCISDPLVHHGRHFGRTVHVLCNVNSIILNGLIRLGDLSEEPEEAFSTE